MRGVLNGKLFQQTDNHVIKVEIYHFYIFLCNLPFQKQSTKGWTSKFWKITAYNTENNKEYYTAIPNIVYMMKSIDLL